MYDLTHQFPKNIESQPESKGNILLVDDTPENLKLLGEILHRAGYTARSVTSGAKAIKTAKAKRPDVMFLDVVMPEMNGYEVCQAFKADPELSDIPIIFISALGSIVDKVKGFEVGGMDYITKPFQVQEVFARLEAQLTIQKQQKSLKNEIERRKEIEEVLYQSRSLLSSILNSALDGIAAMQAVRDPSTGLIEDFRCLAVNPVISRMLKRKRKDLIGKLVLKKFLSKVAPNLFDRFAQVVETGEALAEEFYYPSEDARWYHYVVVKLGDGFAITVRDITERKETELALQEANHKLEKLVNLDGLTHIANRRHFGHYLDLEWQRHQRERNSLSLIMIDIDYFKRYNDHNGHQGGDDCLIRVAQAIAQVPQRPTDLVARYGGEEFAVILSNTDRDGALKIAEEIQLAIATLAIPHEKSEVSEHITLSIGIASMIPPLDQEADVLIRQADQALFAAKGEGRNRAIVAPTL
jgi:diguanylate cyclase (GGDEF)-like protein